MTRVGFILKVREDLIEEYKRRHREVWPEMLDALRRTGWHNYSLFMRDDGLLFGYLETTGTFGELWRACLERKSTPDGRRRCHRSSRAPASTPIG